MGADSKAIGAYEIIQRLAGHPGEVYLARRRDRGTRRQYVLVVFELADEDVATFEAETKRCKQLKHPAIMPIAELFEHQGKRVAVFESTTGAGMQQLMGHLRQAHERLADRAVYYIGWQLFGALAEAHSAKGADGKFAPLIHGQLGPHQVFLSWDGEVQILGFGLSRAFRQLKLSGSVAEALRPYLSPEERGELPATPRANVYDAAAMLWSLLTRQVPEVSKRKLEDLGKLRPELPRGVARGLDQALEPAVQSRVVTGVELAKIFEGAGGASGRQDLRFTMDVYRALARFEEVFLPSGSAPTGAAEPDEPAADSDEPHQPVSESDMPTGQWKIDHAALRQAAAAAAEADADEAVEGDEPTVDGPAIERPAAGARKPDPAAAPLVASSALRSNTLPASGQRGKSSVLGRAGLRGQARRDRKKTIVGLPSQQSTGREKTEQAKPAAVQTVAAAGAGGAAAAAAAAEVPLPRADDAEGGSQSGAWTKSWVGALRPRRSVLSESATEQALAKTQAIPSGSNGGDSGADGLADDGNSGAGRTGTEPATRAAGTLAASPPPVPARRAPQEEPVAASDFLEPEDEAETVALMDAADLAPPALPVSVAPMSGSMAPISHHFIPAMAGSLSPDAVPVSLVGQHATLSIQPPPPAGVSLKVIIAVAVCSVVSFAAGMLIAQRPVDVRLSTGPTSTAAAAAPPAASATRHATAPVAPTATAKAGAGSGQKTDGAGEASERAGAGDESRDRRNEDLDGSRLPESHGYLVVTTSAPNAHVYVNGRPLGSPSEKLMARCGVLHVRVGNNPLTRWYGRGKPVSIACQGVTSVSFDQWMYDDPVPQRRTPGGYIPDGL